MKRMLLLITVIVGLLVPGMVLATDLAVDSQGNISGTVNRLKESVMGESFWRSQLKEARKQLHWETVEFPRMERDFYAENRRLDKEFERDYPAYRPTREERQAELLRQKVDAIESRWVDREIKSYITELRRTIFFIENKLNEYR